MNENKARSLKIGDSVSSGGSTGVVVGKDAEGVAITWTTGSGRKHSPWYDFDELVRYGIEYIEEVHTTLAQEEYQVELSA